MTKPYSSSRTLLSACHDLLVEPRSRLEYGDRAYSVIAPRIWNRLPLQRIEHLQKMKRAIYKTLFIYYLFIYLLDCTN